MKGFRSGLPSANPTTSFWQTPPNPRLENYKSEIFPGDVDIVIIGSGLTGALIAYHLLSRPGPKLSILMLEARTAASGATGRNGGHIKPDCCRGFDEYAQHHGIETALKQCHLEASNLEATIKFIQEKGLAEEVDLVTCNTVDTYMSESSWARGYKSYGNFKNAGGNVSKIEVYRGDEAKTVQYFPLVDALMIWSFTRVPGCVGAISYPAASLWPYKLTIAVLQMALNLGLNLQTNRTVASVETASSGKWKVITHNKEVTTPKVIHATNGYSSYLLPEMTGRIVPLKGHVAAIPPSIKFESKPLDKTMAVIWDSDYDYLIQRQAKGKHVILGGGDLEHPEGLIGPLGDSDDSVMNDEIATALKEFPEAQFEGWSQPADRTVQDRTPQEVLETVVWTGIMGISKDCLPFLGELPGKEGQYIAAGYHGHGMARIFLSVKAFCEFFCGEEIDSRVPSVYFDLATRLQGGLDLVKWGG